MIKSMFPDEPQINICMDCDAEFTIKPISFVDDDIQFCPYCGAEFVNENEENDLFDSEEN